MLRRWQLAVSARGENSTRNNKKNFLENNNKKIPGGGRTVGRVLWSKRHRQVDECRQFDLAGVPIRALPPPPPPWIMIMSHASSSTILSSLFYKYIAYIHAYTRQRIHIVWHASITRSPRDEITAALFSIINFCWILSLLAAAQHSTEHASNNLHLFFIFRNLNQSRLNTLNDVTTSPVVQYQLLSSTDYERKLQLLV